METLRRLINLQTYQFQPEQLKLWSLGLRRRVNIVARVAAERIVADQ